MKKNGSPFTILIVDDDQDNLHMLSLCLKEIGHRILVALDGNSAIEKAGLAKPDLILMDVVMPRMDGFETCEKIKSNQFLSEIPVIFMTSLSDPNSKIKGFEVGGVDYITKPVRFEEVLARVHVHLKLLEQRKELQNQREELEQWAEEEAAMNEELNAMNEELIALNQELTATNEVVFNDNLERKRVEAELAETNLLLTSTIKELKEMQTFLVQSEKMVALGNLVAGLAHEINTPIGVGITASSNLKDMTESFVTGFESGIFTKEESKEYLEDIQESAEIIYKNLDRAGQLIRNFKLVSTDQSEMIKRDINLKQYLNEILLTLRPRIHAGHHEIIVKCDENLEIRTFAGSIAQIFTNMILNSLTHAFTDKKNGIVVIDIRKDDNTLHIVFEDNGKGMAYEVMTRIFDPFFTTKRGQGGTGLGMYIVHNIVTQQFHGTMNCKSEVGVGTYFEMTLQL